MLIQRICLVFVCVFGVSVSGFSQDEPPQPITVENAVLKKIESTTVSGQLTGTIKTLGVQPGDAVKKGEEIGRISDVEIRLKLEQLRSRVEMLREKQHNTIDERLARKSEQVARDEYEQAVQANKLVADTYPPTEIERMRLLADKASLELERAIHEREMLKYDVQIAINEYKQSYENFERHKIVVPLSGVVVNVEKRVGEWVEPGAEILKIVRIDRLRVEGAIPLKAALLDLTGKRAKVTVQADDLQVEMPAKVTFVSPDANPVNSLVSVFLEVDNSKRMLRPGMRVDAVILK